MLDAIAFTAYELIMKPCCIKEMQPAEFVMYISGNNSKFRRIMIYGVPAGNEGHFHLEPTPEHEGYRVFRDPEVMGKLFDVMGWEKQVIYVGSAIPSVIQIADKGFITKDALCISEEFIHSATAADTALFSQIASKKQ
jgi:hypothetical protein